MEGGHKQVNNEVKAAWKCKAENCDYTRPPTLKGYKQLVGHQKEHAHLPKGERGYRLVDEIVNPDFTSGSANWTFIPGVTFSSDQAHFDGTAEGTALYQSILDGAIGAIYLMATDVSAYTSGTLTPRLGSAVFGSPITSAGIHCNVLRKVDVNINAALISSSFIGSVNSYKIWKVKAARISGGAVVACENIGLPTPIMNGLNAYNGNVLSEVKKIAGIGYDAFGNEIQYPRDSGLNLLTGIGANNQYLISETVTIPSEMTLFFLFAVELEDSFIQFGTDDVKGVTSEDNKIILNRAAAHEDVAITIEQKVMAVTISNSAKELKTTSLSGLVDDLTFINTFITGTDDLIVPNDNSAIGANIINLIGFGFVPNQILSENINKAILSLMNNV